jgi:manganese/zinc-transporting P-type ATPase C
MMERLRQGDQLVCVTSGTVWTVRSEMRGRLRLVNRHLQNNGTWETRLQLLAANQPEVAYLRVNLMAGSLLLEHVGLTHWRRLTVQGLLDQLEDWAEQDHPGRAEQRPSGPVLRLSLAGALLLGQVSLAPPWLWPLALGLLPPLLLPLLRELGHAWDSRKLPRESLDLAWYSTLILRGELGTVATELAMENGSQVLQGSLDQGGNYDEILSQELHRWLDEASFTLEDGQSTPSPIALLRRGDRIRLNPGDVVPLDGYIVDGEAVVSKHLLDGENAQMAVRPFQALPVGVLVVEGHLVFKLNQDLSEQPIYNQLLNLNPQEHAPWGIERARRLHRQMMPMLLGGGVISLLLGYPHQAASLMQFDPINDWQLSASVAYRGAQNLCRGWGVRLRQGAVLDRLCQCRTLVISEGAICFGIQRELLGVVSLHNDYSHDALLEIVAGFRRFMQPEAIPLFPLQNLLLQRDLEPRPIADLEPAGCFGLRGRMDGKRVWLGGGELLKSLNIPRPLEMPQQRGLHWTFLLVEHQVVGGLLFRDQLKRNVSRSLRRLRRHGWNLHLVSTWHGDMLESVARQLKLPSDSVHPSVDLSQRMTLIRDFDRSDGPVAYLGSALMDSGAFAEADIALAVSDGTLSLPVEMADIVLPAQRLDRLIDCVSVAEDIGANNRHNFYLTLLPHASALLLSFVVQLDPLIAVLLADMPMLLVELNNLQTYNHLRSHHRLGWKAQRKRTSRRRPTTRAPLGARARQLAGSG